jgi:hypothetical protein
MGVYFETFSGTSGNLRLALFQLGRHGAGVGEIAA